jgi:hypothetical protein
MKLGRRDYGMFLAVAVSGVLAGSLVGCKQEAANSGGNKAGATATADKHACKGMNTCAGKGGCSTGDKGCAGKNTCAKKGGCASADAKHDCAGKNSCKTLGGCKTGDKGCAGKNSCAKKGGCKVPVAMK